MLFIMFIISAWKIMDIKFYSILLDYPSNYDQIRKQARDNVIYFLNDKKDLFGDPKAFLHVQIAEFYDQIDVAGHSLLGY